jgi:hypothetical protein
MPRVGFEPTITVLEQSKAMHGLHRAATVIGEPTHFPKELGNRQVYFPFLNNTGRFANFADSLN